MTVLLLLTKNDWNYFEKQIIKQKQQKTYNNTEKKE